jgi:dienelactone hydrolase
MSLSRRKLCRWLAGSALTAGVETSQAATQLIAAPPQTASGSHIGNLYPFAQKQADRSTLELSFLRPEFRDLTKWQKQARAKVFEHLFYEPAPVSPQPQVIRRAEKGDYIEEYLTFQTTPDLRVPAYVLVPKKAKLPAPGIVVLHDHGGFYLWGKEKVIELEVEPPALSEFKQQAYGGKSIAVELARRGFVVINIDMFYWGERRMLLDDDPASYQEPGKMTPEEVSAFNRRSQQSEQLVARTLFAAGITWPGVILWDDIRTLDYLRTRPEVDPKRIGCVGLSVGGYRSFVLAALDERIQAAVNVGWMTSLASQIKRHAVNSIGLTFHIIGLYRYLDFPDLAALIAPRAVMVMNGSQDRLFAPEGVQAAFDKIARCFAKAGVSERQRCRLFDLPHVFNQEMQAEAWEWIQARV